MINNPITFPTCANPAGVLLYIRRRRLFKWNLRRTVSRQPIHIDLIMSSFLIDSLMQSSQRTSSPVSNPCDSSSYNMMACTYCWTPHHDKVSFCQLCIPARPNIGSYAMPVRSQVIPSNVHQNAAKDFSRMQNPFLRSANSSIHLESSFGEFYKHFRYIQTIRDPLFHCFARFTSTLY